MNAMIQFGAHIKRYGKQRATKTEERRKNLPPLDLSSSDFAKHPNMPKRNTKECGQTG